MLFEKTIIPTPPKRMDSERRDRLFPHEPDEHERREGSATRRRALSAQPKARWPLISFDQRSVPDTNIPMPDSIASTLPYQPAGGTNINWPKSVFHREPSVLSSETSQPNNRQQDRDHLSNIDNTSDADIFEGSLHDDELERRWILNLSMHFRDNSSREKFFILYAETPRIWRRLTVSCDYRGAPPDSLEADLSTLHYQRDKSARIYEALRDCLLDVQFYDTVTNLRLETANGRLHIHVTEDVNEIIQYPPLGAIEHLTRQGCPLVQESDVDFVAHLSGFVYKVAVNGCICVKKEIPYPDTVDEFLYEVNALFALRNHPQIIDFLGVVISDEHPPPPRPPSSTSDHSQNNDDNDHNRTVASTATTTISMTIPTTPTIKGLLISFAPSGALVDLLLTHTSNPHLGLIPWPRRHKWALQILRGLHAIHSAGFVQGDFTLANIVISHSHNSTSTQHSNNSHRITTNSADTTYGDLAQIIDINRRGCPMGWEPPELEGLIRSGQRLGMYIGVKTDLWQLGMVLWALAMHNAEPEREEEELDFDDEDPEIAHVGHAYRNVVRCCLAPDPKERREVGVLLGWLEGEEMGLIGNASRADDLEGRFGRGMDEMNLWQREVGGHTLTGKANDQESTYGTLSYPSRDDHDDGDHNKNNNNASPELTPQPYARHQKLSYHTTSAIHPDLDLGPDFDLDPESDTNTNTNINTTKIRTKPLSHGPPSHQDSGFAEAAYFGLDDDNEGIGQSDTYSSSSSYSYDTKHGYHHQQRQHHQSEHSQQQLSNSPNKTGVVENASDSIFEMPMPEDFMSAALRGRARSSGGGGPMD